MGLELDEIRATLIERRREHMASRDSTHIGSHTLLECSNGIHAEHLDISSEVEYGVKRGICMGFIL
jgi:hypothetical protein